MKYHPLTPWIRCLNQSDWLPFGEQKGDRMSTMDLVCQVYMETSSNDSRVDIESCVLEVRRRAIFLSGWCDDVIDSALDFCLLGESVP